VGLSAVQARAVPTSSFLAPRRRHDSPPSLEFRAKRREGGDLMCSLSDPLVEHPKETRPDARRAGYAGRFDEVTDGIEGQPESLSLANELQPVEI
jgi:hypothetical protein